MFIKLNSSIYNKNHISHVSKMFYRTKSYEGYYDSDKDTYVIEIELLNGSVMKMHYKKDKDARDSDFIILSNFLEPQTIIGSYRKSNAT